MEDYTKIKKVIQTTDADEVQNHLDTGLWVILAIANGQNPDLSAYQLFTLGSCSPDAERLPLRGKNVTYI